MLLNDAELDRIEIEVFRLLEDVGLDVRDDEITRLLLESGCKSLPNGRLRIPRELASEVVAFQQARCSAPASEPAGPQRPAALETAVMHSAFVPGPTVCYDYGAGEVVGVTDEIARRVLQLADATPEVASVHCLWRPGLRPETESIDMLIDALKITRKPTGLDAIFPGQVKYLVEISEIVTGEAGSSYYLAGSQCITPPLILGSRSAGEMLERKKCGVAHYFVATMTLVGVSSPVTRPGAVIAGAAEILGGWVAAHAVAPEGSLTGGAFVSCMDMASGEVTMASPAMAWINAAIRELFERRLGGHVSTGTHYAPCAKVPGLQATYENYFIACAAARLEGGRVSYPGRGLLDNGGVGSPEQLMLDIEARTAIEHLEMPLSLDDDSLALDALREVVPQGSIFLDHEHTRRHCREEWTPRFFLWDSVGPGSRHGDGSERAILDRAHEACEENIKRYQPPEWPRDVLRALDRVAQKARQEFCGT